HQHVHEDEHPRGHPPAVGGRPLALRLELLPLLVAEALGPARRVRHQKIIGRSSSSSVSRSRSTTTGTWSLGASPERSSRSIDARPTGSASSGVPSTKSMRMPSFLFQRPAL